MNFIKPELVILIPVIYLIGVAIKKSKVNDTLIPIILGAISVCLCALWIGSTSSFTIASDFMLALFTAIVQGILIAGASVYTNQFIKQSQKDE